MNINITTITTTPFPHVVIDNVLPEQLVSDLQEEITNIPSKQFDYIINPFEKKKVLKGAIIKEQKLPTKTLELFKYLESKEFISKLENTFNTKLIVDSERHFHGIHKIDECGDLLDIHLDSSIHPVLNLKKKLTVGLYLSKNWNDLCQGEL